MILLRCGGIQSRRCPSIPDPALGWTVRAPRKKPTRRMTIACLMPLSYSCYREATRG